MTQDAFVMHIEGLEETRKALAQIGRYREVNRVLRKSALPFLPLVAAEAPVGDQTNKGIWSGQLAARGVRDGRQRNIKKAASKSVRVSTSLQGVAIKSFAHHAWFIYRGVAGVKGSSAKARPTSKGPNPFLHRGIGRQLPLIRPSIEGALEDLFDAAAKLKAGA